MGGSRFSAYFDVWVAKSNEAVATQTWRQSYKRNVVLKKSEFVLNLLTMHYSIKDQTNIAVTFLRQCTLYNFKTILDEIYRISSCFSRDKEETLFHPKYEEKKRSFFQI